MQRPNVRKRFSEECVEALGSTPEDSSTYTRAEIERWAA